FLSLMIDWQMFSSLKGSEPRSLKSFVIKYKWLEGMQVSQNRTADFWNEWSMLFHKAQLNAQSFGNRVWQNLLYSETKHSDGLQAIYISLNPALKKVLVENQSL